MTDDNDGNGPEDFVDDGSPVTLNQEEWADMDAELKEFMGSDIDSESDNESVSSALSLRERNAANKRTRDEFEENAIHDRDKRNGGSALKTVAIAESASPNPDVVGDAATSEERILKEQTFVEEQERNEEAAEEDSDDELARELEREFEEEDDEAVVS
jgi:RNA polymerase II subunit A-like phosphatase